MEEERALAVFERKILRKIYGPVKENELWRIRQNDELHGVAIMKLDCFYYSFPAMSMTKRRVGH
jgi:hypothetical protein